MPDISMCQGLSCRLKQECYRFRAIPSQYAQTYFMTPPVGKDGKCEEFLPILKSDKILPICKITKAIFDAYSLTQLPIERPLR